MPTPPNDACPTPEELAAYEFLEYLFGYKLRPQQQAALLAWSLYDYPILYPSGAANIIESTETQACALVKQLAVCLPITTTASGWRVDKTAPLRCPPITNQQRAAILAWTLAHGKPLTTREAAALVGLARNSALILLQHISAVVPITDEDPDVLDSDVPTWTPRVWRRVPAP